jgi:hypothetical protein
MISVSPVLTTVEVDAEKVVALDQPQFRPLLALRVEFKDGQRFTALRFQFTAEERAAIAAGQDLLVLQPHHGSLMPLAFQFALPGKYPELNG